MQWTEILKTINLNFSTQQFALLTRRWLRAVLTFTIALLCVSLIGCSSGDTKQQKAQAAAPRSVSVAVAKVEQQDVPVYLTGLGSVTAFNTANIKSRVDGQIMQVNVKEGQNVKQGELLVVIDPRPFQVQMEQMQAQLFKDQATLRDAKLNLDRYTALIPSGSIAQQQVDTQKATVDQLEGQVRTDQAQVDNARLQITYCHITAPFAGRIGLRQVDPGNIVHASDTNPMLILTQLQPIAVIFTLPEDQLQTVSRHMKNSTLQVDVYGRDNQTKLATGKLQTIDNQIDQTTGTAKLKAVFDNIDNQLWPNQFVRDAEEQYGSAHGRDSARAAGNICLRLKARQNRRSAHGSHFTYAGQHHDHHQRPESRRHGRHRWAGQAANGQQGRTADQRP